MIGHVFEIQPFSIHDGPGIRCNVFLKGCNLHCLWCHNPEGRLLRPVELSFVPSRCVGCGYCFRACKRNCHIMIDGKHIIQWDRCVRCGLCAKECYSNALTTVGYEATPEEVIEEVMRDAIFFDTSGGGITLSGGEPMMQHEFVRDVLTLAKQHGLHTALETCLAYDYGILDGIKENVDLFLADYKATNPQDHKRFTGVDNQIIIENLANLYHDGMNVLIRCPIIEGLNDTDEHFRRIAELTQQYPSFMGAELLPYHRLGISKIERFGLKGDIQYAEYQTPSLESQQRWIDTVRCHGGRLINDDVLTSER
mgnify:CR=1 FL=1